MWFGCYAVTARTRIRLARFDRECGEGYTEEDFHLKLKGKSVSELYTEKLYPVNKCTIGNASWQ